MKVAPSFGEAQSAVWPASNPIRVVVVLPVVLPEAYGADLVVAGLAERDKAAAGTAVWASLGLPLNVDERSDHGCILPRSGSPRRPYICELLAGGHLRSGGLVGRPLRVVGGRLWSWRLLYLTAVPQPGSVAHRCPPLSVLHLRQCPRGRAPRRTASSESWCMVRQQRLGHELPRGAFGNPRSSGNC